MTMDLCPLCKQEGDRVALITVESLVKDYFRKHLKSYTYGFCTNPKCNVVYYNNDTDEIYFQRDLKVPVWFKEQDNPIICYCKNVTLKDIIDEIAIKKTSSTVEDIISKTGAMKGCQCKTQNPSGKCCRPVLEDAVAFALELRDKEK
ncbi:(2Fe-2S)-binding protein [Fonticella tunisiensis]|uniref:BFD-like [2Fe-2S] binding protein n=1 Tax=Fonticella tunisiensis TaxID=1096341 RepID=A0A4R7K9I8_9CLOT|nr:(2Fe-2S)-binding protein [Fonticella tunisiensis]TDT50721.1 BFD-like [2Fe-2S] binding protein [Fonticella tunisiensis]